MEEDTQDVRGGTGARGQPDLPNTFVESWTSEKPVTKVAEAGLRPTSPVITDGGTVEIPVLARTTKLIAERRFTATGERARV